MWLKLLLIENRSLLIMMIREIKEMCFQIAITYATHFRCASFPLDTNMHINDSLIH